jgi:hypothetical protein
MANFKVELPTEILTEIEKIDKNVDKIFGGMTEAGADIVVKNARSGAPSEIVSHIKKSKTYKTPSDGGINTKVYVGGYLKFKNGRKSFTRRGGGGSKYTTNKGVPASFIAKVFEYGTSNRQTDSGANRGRIIKRPFFRKSFNKAQITSAMKAEQKKLSGGILDE